MAWIRLKEKILWYVAIALCLAGLLADLRASNIWDQYYDQLPRSSVVATGSIYPLNIHGVVVFQTLNQQARLRWWDFWSTAVFCLGMALGAAHKWISARRGTGPP
jgi:hypothetical protein